MRPRIWLCLGPLLFCVLDGGLTLHGQSDAYWSGQYEQALEGNPLGRWPLERHPGLFLLSLACWMIIFTGFILKLPLGLAWPTSYSIHVGHSFGAACWLLLMGRLGFVGAVLLLLCSRFLMDLAYSRAGVAERVELLSDRATA